MVPASTTPRLANRSVGLNGFRGSRRPGLDWDCVVHAQDNFPFCDPTEIVPMDSIDAIFFTLGSSREVFADRNSE